jgi:biopolymer transport protein ExbD
MSSGRKRFSQTGAASPTSVNLTALMDILSNIIFFLLASFGAQTMQLTSANKVKLPSSTSELALKMTMSVAVGLDEVFVEDEPIAKLKDGQILGLDAERFLPKLEETLKRVRAQKLAKNERPTDEDEVVLFIADKRLKFDVIDRVMKTCAKAGFTKFRFAVAKK